MDIKLPKHWTENSSRVNDTYILAKNDNGVSIGYKHLDVGAFSVWVGDDWEDNKTLDANISSESEAKQKCLEFMRKYPNVAYQSTGISGKLLDNENNRISSRSI